MGSKTLCGCGIMTATTTIVVDEQCNGTFTLKEVVSYFFFFFFCLFVGFFIFFKFDWDLILLHQDLGLWSDRGTCQ